MDIRLGYFTSLDEDFNELLEESLKEGHQFLQRFKDQWEIGENRFDRDGEMHIVAVEGMRPVGICGLNIDPYLNDSKIGRVRHLYVHPDFRGLTIGSILVNEVIDCAKDSFNILRLRTKDDGAAKFYLKLGFETSNEENETHRLILSK